MYVIHMASNKLDVIHMASNKLDVIHMASNSRICLVCKI